MSPLKQRFQCLRPVVLICGTLLLIASCIDTTSRTRPEVVGTTSMQLVTTPADFTGAPVAGGYAQIIGAGPAAPWVGGGGNQTLYRYTGATGARAWSPVPAPSGVTPSRIAVSPEGDAWIVGTNHLVYRYIKGSGWDPGNPLGGTGVCAVDIGVGGDRYALVLGCGGAGSGNATYYWGESDGHWHLLDSTVPAVRIAVSPEGLPWVIDNQNPGVVYQWQTSANAYVATSGRGSAIGVGPNNVAWVVGPSTWMWNGTGFTEMSSAYPLKEISVGADGTPWGITTSNQIARWGAPWTSLGPAGFLNVQPANAGTVNYKWAGDVEDIDVSDFIADNRVYAGTAGGGVWVASTSASTWTWGPLPNFQSYAEGPSLAIGSLALNPTDPTKLVVATGVYSGNLPQVQKGNGIWSASLTYGIPTWTHATCTPSANSATPVSKGCPPTFRKIRYNPANTMVIFAVTMDNNPGLYVSTDGGKTFNLNTQLLAQDNDLAVDSTGILYLATSNGSVAISTNNGGNFSLTVPFSSSSIQYPTIAVAPSDTSTIYVTESGRDGFHGVFIGENRQSGLPTWAQTELSPGQSDCLTTGNPQCWIDNTSPTLGHVGATAVSPNNPYLVIAAGIKPWISNINGNGILRWALPEQLPGNYNNEYHNDVHVVAFAGASVFLGNDGGISYSSDSGAHWTDVNNTISAAQDCGLSVFGDTIVGAAWDIGIHLSFDHGSSWTANFPNLDDDSKAAMIVPSGALVQELFVYKRLPNQVFKGTLQSNSLSWANNGNPIYVNGNDPGRMVWTTVQNKQSVYVSGGGSNNQNNAWNGVWTLDDGNGGSGAYAQSQGQLGDTPTAVTAFNYGGNLWVMTGSFLGGGCQASGGGCGASSCNPGNLKLSENGGPWVEIGENLPVGSNPGPAIMAIRKDWDGPGNIYVLTGYGRVFVDSMSDITQQATLCQQPNWTEISGNLSSLGGKVTFYDIMPDLSLSNRSGPNAFVATSVGVFKTTNSCALMKLEGRGNCWNTIWQPWDDGFPLSPAQLGTDVSNATSAASGYPGLAVLGLDGQVRSDGRFYLYAATWERGIWVRDATADDP